LTAITAGVELSQRGFATQSSDDEREVGIGRLAFTNSTVLAALEGLSSEESERSVGPSSVSLALSSRLLGKMDEPAAGSTRHPRGDDRRDLPPRACGGLRELAESYFFLLVSRFAAAITRIDFHSAGTSDEP
jgi:hypothetical protein